MLLKNKIAIVTGSNSGIGKGIALRFAREGAIVSITGRRAEAVRATADEVRSNGGECFEFVGDLTDPETIRQFFNQVDEQFGRVDILVNNLITQLGRGEQGPFLLMELDDWQEFLNRNLTALFLCTHLATTMMAREKIHGNVINISSVGADRAHRYSIAYDSLKGAIDSFTRAVAVDLGPWGIRVNALRPGPIMVEKRSNYSDPAPHPNPQVPLGRMGYPADVAWAAVFLAADDASFITGQNFQVDGGLLAQARLPQNDEGQELITPDNIDQLDRKK